jgi:Flp pilus assembly protein TadG
MMLHRIRRDGSRGQALVEFALVVPIFVLLLVGLFDIGRAVWNYNTVANAAREAARVAVVNQDQTVIREAAKTAGVSLSLEDADITLNPCTDQECPYSVTVTYDYEPVTPLIGSLINLTLTSTAVMPLEYENPGP